MQNLADRVEMELWQRLTSHLYERVQGDDNRLYQNEAKEFVWDRTYLDIDQIVWTGCDRIRIGAIQQYQHQNKNNGN